MLTPVPEWIQTVALAFSLFLIAPSWASVINGFYTMNGNWDKMKSNYLVKFFILGITFYGLQTIQGPTQAIRALSATSTTPSTSPATSTWGRWGG